MTHVSFLKRILTRSRGTLKYLVDLEHNRRFERWPGSYRGVFESFAEARASAPGDKLGFDHPELAHLYDARMGKAFPSDYPVLFWLSRLLPHIGSVFDWGGHIGISYYTYAKYLDFSKRLRWHVGDVPQIVKAGRELAASRAAGSLSFTTEFAEADGLDLLLANGSLQFVEVPLADSLRGLRQLPRHLLVNKVPLYEGDAFVTLENTVHSYNPYRVGNKKAFVESIVACGYALEDTWENPDVSCHIPLHRERSVSSYSGFYFRTS